MNEKIFYFFYNFAHQSVILDKGIVFIAEIFPYIVLMLAGLFLLFHHDIFKAENPFQTALKKWKEFLPLAISVLLSFVLAQFILKPFFHTLRPFDLLNGVKALFFESGYAFPSGHSMVFMALAFSIYFSHKKAGYVFMFLALLIGISRIVSGVHFPIDILGGFVFGATIAALIKLLYKKI